MNRLLVCGLMLAASLGASAQSLDDLNIQIHGYATQGFLYSTQNNVFTTTSSDGSPAWTEAVVNVTAQPNPKLRVGVQARYFLLGTEGNAITLDWAAADFKANDKFGVRFGKVKTPTGLYNDVQDIDPSYMWSVLPQGVYPLLSRNSLLSLYGGVVYGTLNLGEKMGKLEYRGFGGERVLASDDGAFISQTEQGIKLPDGVTSVNIGAALHWRTPIPGVMLGASNFTANKSTAALAAGPLSGAEIVSRFNFPDYFARYEKDKILVVYEWTRSDPKATVALTGPPPMSMRIDARSWYGMAGYKVTGKLTLGAYDSQSFNFQAPLGPGRFSKDWVVSGRYDFNEYLYAKAEQHFIDGAFAFYYPATNAGGIKPSSKLTIFKIGVSF